MNIPSFEEYIDLSPRRRRAVRRLQKLNGLAVYHANGRKRPTKPHLWRSGPDERRHYLYHRWGTHRGQALYRGEEYALTFEQFETIWGEHWDQRGRSTHSMIMTRQDMEKGWTPENTIIMERLQHMRRMSEIKRLKKL